MAMPRKPASLKKGNTESKEMLKERELLEEKLRGNDNLLEEVPAHLDEYAKEYYVFLIEELKESGLLCNLDIPTIANAADCVSKMIECDNIINRDGLIEVSYDKFGTPIKKENPAIKTKHNYMTKYVQLSNALGLDPSSRASLAAKKIEAKETQASPLMQILNDDSDF